jgi:hypothetical protein
MHSRLISMLAALAALSATAEAHHSFAMYDRTQSLTFTGRLTRFIPGANHAQLIFELIDQNGEPVVGDDGNPVAWGVETGPAASIAQQGITVASFPLGTVMTVSLNPLRDGRTFGVLAGAVVKCGMELPAGGCTAETGESFGGGPDD